MVLDMAGIELRLQKLERVSAQPFTVLGWEVHDATQAARQLASKGIDAVRYDGMPQDEDGIWTAPDRTRVLWFRDPDGNVLSLTERAKG